MKILITGNMGYVGPVLTRHLRKTILNAKIYGYDQGYFAHCLTGSSIFPETLLDRQYYGDVRNISDEILCEVDAIVHLAAVSNDPMGLKYESVTSEINYEATINIAKRAIKAGIKRFVFASSCSMYGYAIGGPRKETDSVNPLTAYAKSKNATEEGLSTMETGEATVTSLRFSTACGMSDRVRLDLVLNDFVACAISSKNITVLSDGSPWRPLIDVKDMSRAIEWALLRNPSDAGNYVAVNVGSDGWNYQVRDLAFAVAKAVPGTEVNINTNAPPDQRSYQVNFDLFKRIAPSHQPQVTLDQAIGELIEGMERMSFKDAEFRSSQFMRLKVLERLSENGLIDKNLNWIR